MTAPFRSVARVLADRQQEVAQVADVSGDYYVLTGDVEVGIGDTQVDISFAVRFVEKPVFTWGVDLGDNPYVAVSKNFPTASVIVGRWDIGVRAETGSRFYDGAVLLCVTTGLSGNYPLVNYRFEGRALTGPAGRQDLGF